jgi:hypothetical protein
MLKYHDNNPSHKSDQSPPNLYAHLHRRDANDSTTYALTQPNRIVKGGLIQMLVTWNCLSWNDIYETRLGRHFRFTNVTCLRKMEIELLPQVELLEKGIRRDILKVILAFCDNTMLVLDI